MSRALPRDAGLGRRAAAVLVDGVLLACAFAALNLVLWKSGLAAALAADADAGVLEVWRRPDVALASAAGVALCVLLAWRVLGGTPGALLMGMVLLPPAGGRPGLARAALRLLAVAATGGLGILWSLGGRAALHDRVSGLRLVVEDELWIAPVASGPVAKA